VGIQYKWQVSYTLLSLALRASCRRAIRKFEPAQLPQRPWRWWRWPQSLLEYACWPWQACAQIVFSLVCYP